MTYGKFTLLILNDAKFNLTVYSAVTNREKTLIFRV